MDGFCEIKNNYYFGAFWKMIFTSYLFQIFFFKFCLLNMAYPSVVSVFLSYLIISKVLGFCVAVPH